MKDIIYRDDAVALVIKAIHGTDNKEIQNYLLDGLRKQMWSLPSIESSQDWIPITESEPNTADHVLVTYKWDDDDYETSELDYWVNKYEAEHGNERCKFFHDHITAWQLKPMPYKGGDSK